MKLRSTSVLAAIAAVSLLLAGCNQGALSNEDAEEIRAQISDVQARLNAVEERISEMAETAGDGAEELVNEAQQELDQARDVLAQVDERLAPPPPPADDLGDPGMTAPAAPGGLDAPAF